MKSFGFGGLMVGLPPIKPPQAHGLSSGQMGLVDGFDGLEIRIFDNLCIEN